MLNTILNIIKDYEAKGMIDTKAALAAINMDKNKAAHTVATKEQKEYIEMMAFTHVEGDEILKNSSPKFKTAYAIITIYYKKLKNTDASLIGTNTLRNHLDIIDKYLALKN